MAEWDSPLNQTHEGTEMQRKRRELPPHSRGQLRRGLKGGDKSYLLQNELRNGEELVVR